MEAKKSLGQHWLKDIDSLEMICRAAELGKADIVLEIGPGLGSLTERLVKQAGKVIAVELDSNLAAKLATKTRTTNLEVVQGDILKFDLTQLPVNYKVVANIPYYLTSKLIRVLSESSNSPVSMILLVQREVAQRIAAGQGQMSLLSVSTQLYFAPKLGPTLAAKLFEPPPKVDSQLIILKRRDKPLFKDLDVRVYFRLVKAGFAGRRKKLRGSLAAGLSIPKEQADKLLQLAKIDGNLRAQELTLRDWHSLYSAYKKSGPLPQ